jgi:crotonobetainyl-CoA:carnitine CoA-transferase CaiB-like acyl-CoA transferase
MWPRFCQAIRREEFVQSSAYATPQARRQNREALNGAISDVTKTMTTDTIVELMNQSEIPCGPIYTIDQTFADPQVRHLGISQRVVSPGLGNINLVGQPFSLSRTPNRLVSAAPGCGEHTEQVLAELGYSEETIGGLREAGVI